MTKLTRKQVVNLLLSKNSTLTENTAILWNNEYSPTDSLRLSKSGLYDLKNHFKSFLIPLKKGFQVKNVHIKYLERDLIYPYYLDNKQLILFNGKDVLDIKLHDGDLDAWARARYMDENYQEPPTLPEEKL